MSNRCWAWIFCPLFGGSLDPKSSSSSSSSVLYFLQKFGVAPRPENPLFRKKLAVHTDSSAQAYEVWQSLPWSMFFSTRAYRIVFRQLCLCSIHETHGLCYISALLINYYCAHIHKCSHVYTGRTALRSKSPAEVNGNKTSSARFFSKKNKTHLPVEELLVRDINWVYRTCCVDCQSITGHGVFTHRRDSVCRPSVREKFPHKFWIAPPVRCDWHRVKIIYIYEILQTQCVCVQQNTLRPRPASAVYHFRTRNRFPFFPATYVRFNYFRYNFYHWHCAKHSTPEFARLSFNKIH